MYSYVNNLPDVLTRSHTYVYTDDIALVVHDDDMNNIFCDPTNEGCKSMAPKAKTQHKYIEIHVLVSQNNLSKITKTSNKFENINIDIVKEYQYLGILLMANYVPTNTSNTSVVKLTLGWRL